MDPLDLAYWIDAVYSTIVCSDGEDDEFRELLELWFKELIGRRERRTDEMASVGDLDRS
jgi:hypothetical protein